MPEEAFRATSGMVVFHLNLLRLPRFSLGRHVAEDFFFVAQGDFQAVLLPPFGRACLGEEDEKGFG
jgi:hypothetical protein